MTSLDSFINKLPINLRMDISMEMHKSTFKKFDLFERFGEQRKILPWIASKMRPRFFTENTYLYQKGDNIDNFYFNIMGISCFVIPEYKNIMCGIVDPQRSLMQTRKRKRIMQFCGLEDSVLQTTAIIHDNFTNVDSTFKLKENGM